MLLRMICGIASGAAHDWQISATIFVALYGLDFVVSHTRRTAHCTLRELCEHNLSCSLLEQPSIATDIQLISDSGDDVSIP
jgi:hypothetical protein